MTDTTTTHNLTGTYNLDPAHTRFGFVARHAMVTKVRGQFNDIEGSLQIDADDPTNSSAEVVIQAKSIDTRNSDRDEHLRSNDFFAMDEYPEIIYKSTAIRPIDDNTFEVTGDLTIRGVTKEITVEVEHTGAVIDPWENLRIGFEGSTEVNRKDWGVNWNAALEAGGVMVSEKATIEFEIAAVKAG